MIIVELEHGGWHHCETDEKHVSYFFFNYKPEGTRWYDSLTMFDVVSQSDFSKGLRWYVICLFCISILKAVACTYAQKRTYVYVPCWRFTHLALEVGEKFKRDASLLQFEAGAKLNRETLLATAQKYSIPVTCFAPCEMNNW